MPCGLCHRKEKNANEEKDYLCGSCLMFMISLDRNGKRSYIDSLYLKDQEKEAVFLERFFDGGVSKTEPPKIKPKLLSLPKNIKL